jgi:flagellar biosynthesis chaperone FliJ
MSKSWLSGLLRARRAQEDFAAQQLAAAQRRAQRAAARVHYDRDRLETLKLADASYAAPAFVAAAVALQAAAATHAAAVAVAEHAVVETQERRGELGDAARARRSVEELHDRHLAEAEAHARRAAQAELDEIAARISRDARSRP